MPRASLAFVLLFLLGCAAPSPGRPTTLSETTGGARWMELTTAGPVGEDVLAACERIVRRRFGWAVRRTGGVSDLSSFYDAGRRQYNAGGILAAVARRRSSGAFRTVCLCEADIFIPERDFVFGVASRRSRTALVSVCRLRSTRYGMSPDPALLEKRLRKLLLHELGHTFGLDHCRNGCVMAFARSLPQLDASADDYCADCRRRCEKILGSGR